VRLGSKLFNRNRALTAGLAALAAALALSLVFARNSDQNALSAPELDVPQDASAHHSGVTFTVSAAAFSGTGTYVRLTATLERAESGPVRLTISPTS
jgi:polyisoprenoid-binding protein YceI